MDFRRVLIEATPLLLDGVKMTVLISLLSLIIGMIIGLLICFMGRSRIKIVKFISAVYIWIIRGTPMIVQAFIVYFGMPQLIQLWIPTFRIDPFLAGLITLTMNASAYLSEIFRGGINSVNYGQIEAARSLGLNSAKTMIKVVLPQAFKHALPSMVNQFIITIKDTSILSVIGLSDLVNRGKVYVGKSYQFFATYIIIAVYYLIVISILMVISNILEKKINYEKKGNSN